jgi:hypothetical protein
MMGAGRSVGVCGFGLIVRSGGMNTDEGALVLLTKPTAECFGWQEFRSGQIIGSG